MKIYAFRLVVCSIALFATCMAAPLAGQGAGFANAAEPGMMDKLGTAAKDAAHSVGHAAKSAAHAIGSAAESTVDYADDSVVTARVKGQYLNVKDLDSLDISVKTEDGVVTLSGKVDDQAQADLAGHVAGQVVGVKKVINNIQVKH